jgi:hypothetical protein
MIKSIRVPAYILFEDILAELGKNVEQERLAKSAATTATTATNEEVGDKEALAGIYTFHYVVMCRFYSSLPLADTPPLSS